MATREDIIRKAEKFELRGRWDRAIQQYRKLLDEKSDDPRLLNRIGDLLSRTGEVNEAVGLFQRVAVYYEREGLLHKAVATNKKIHKLQGNNAAVVEKLCALYARQGLHIEAKSHFLALARLYSESGQNERVLDVYQRLVDLEPGNHELRLNLADLLRRDGKKQQAFAEYLRIGKLYADKGNHREGAAALEKALSIDPENPEVVRRLVSHYLSQDQPDRAEAILQEGIARAPRSTFLLLLQAKLCIQAGRIEEALEAYLHLLDEDADISDGLEELTEAALRIEDNNARRRFFERLQDKFIERNRPDRAARALLALLPSDDSGRDLLGRIRELVHQVEREEQRLPLMSALAAGYRAVGNAAGEQEAIEEVLAIDPMRREDLVRLKQLQAEAPAALQPDLDWTPPAVGEGMSFSAPPPDPFRSPEHPDVVGGDPSRSRSVTASETGARLGERTVPQAFLQSEIGAMLDPSAGSHNLPAATAEPIAVNDLEPPALVHVDGSDPDASVHSEANLKPELTSSQAGGWADLGAAEELERSDLEAGWLASEEKWLPSFSELAPQLEDIAVPPEDRPQAGAAALPEKPEPLDEETLSRELDILSQTLRQRGETSAPESEAWKQAPGSSHVIHAASAFGAEPRRAGEPPKRRRAAVAPERFGDQDGSSYYQLGMAFKQMDLIEDALQEFALASQDHKLREAASKMAGICCMQSRKYVQAIEWFERSEEASVEANRKAELLQLIAKARELQRGQRGFKVSVLS